MAIKKLADGTMSDAYGNKRQPNLKYTADGKIDPANFAGFSLGDTSGLGPAIAAAQAAAIRPPAAPPPVPIKTHEQLVADFQGFSLGDTSGLATAIAIAQAQSEGQVIPPLDPVMAAALVPPPTPPVFSVPIAPPVSTMKKLLPFIPAVLGVAGFPVIGLVAPAVGGAGTALWMLLRKK